MFRTLAVLKDQAKLIDGEMLSEATVMRFESNPLINNISLTFNFVQTDSKAQIKLVDFDHLREHSNIT